MNRFENDRKSQNMTITMFEDYLKDVESDTQSDLGIVLETINVLNDSKLHINEIKIKDQLIGGNTAILGMVEGDIAKMVVREYENCQNIMRFLS